VSPLTGGALLMIFEKPLAHFPPRPPLAGPAFSGSILY